MKTIESQVEEVIRSFTWTIHTPLGGFSNQVWAEKLQIESRITQALTERERIVREETEKAFGGCKKCYGKGYSTVLDNTTHHADFPGDKTYTTRNNPMRYCSCDRGKQLEKLVQEGANK